MNWLSGALLALILLATPSAADTLPFRNPALEAEIEALFAPGRDAADVKLAVDHMADPASDIEAERKSIDRMEAELNRMADGAETSLEKLKVLKRFIYESGGWNGENPFSYDFDDPRGSKPANRFLSRYVTSHRGNCVTMPILFMILGQRLGLQMTLAEAPFHLFVKFTDDTGAVWNLEATSGGGFSRDLWYRKNLPMADKAVEAGTYLRALTPQETAGIMASFLVEHFMSAGRYEDAVAAADVILRHYPNSAYVLAKKGSAYALILRRDIIAKYAKASEMTPEIRAYADALYAQNLAAFAQAEALGWTEGDGIK